MITKQIDIIDNYKDFVDSIFNEAIKVNASDIHFEPQKDEFIIRFRIDWEIFVFYKIENSNKDNLLTRVKIMASLKIDESRIPQDWQIVFLNNWIDIDMRVSTFPVLYWEKIVIRILKKDVTLLNINSLWFLQINLNLIKKALTYKEGLILVSWPTWSWKTTTLYSMLNSFDPTKYNISTLEDPVEYKMVWINQSQVRSDIWYTFSNWLRTLLRQDPDIILVWEIRDKETAKLAIEASLTWHLVFGTIHSNRWAWVIERLINMWIEPYLLASALKLIISQRLVKKFCKCCEKIELVPEEEKIYMDWLWPIWESVKANFNWKKSKWCDKCMNIWYSWRLWIHEVVLFDWDFWKIILQGLDKNSWENAMISKWYLNIYQDALLKAASGFTDISQVLPYKDV